MQQGIKQGALYFLAATGRAHVGLLFLYLVPVQDEPPGMAKTVPMAVVGPAAVPVLKSLPVTAATGFSSAGSVLSLSTRQRPWCSAEGRVAALGAAASSTRKASHFFDVVQVPAGVHLYSQGGA